MYKKNLWKRAICKLPMDIQFFAESGTDGSGEQAADVDILEKPDEELSIEELRKALDESRSREAQATTREAQTRAEKEKLKTSVDSLTKKNKELTVQVRERMTADEQASEELKAQREAEKQELEELKTWKTITEATGRYKVLKMDDKMAKECAEAEVSGDFQKITDNYAKHIKAVEKAAAENAINQFLSDRPDIKAGAGKKEEEPLSVLKAKELIEKRGAGGVNMDILKAYM